MIIGETNINHLNTDIILAISLEYRQMLSVYYILYLLSLLVYKLTPSRTIRSFINRCRGSRVFQYLKQST